MKREKEHLIHDLLADDRCRNETLAAGANILRHRRQRRAAWQTLALVTVAVAGLWLTTAKHQPPARVQVLETKTVPAEQAKALTDEELLALFPHTPVGLAKLPNGKKILIFPRPGDEQRFITRL